MTEKNCCYETALRWLLKKRMAGENVDGLYLVHGVVTCPLDGVEMGHAWIEDERDGGDPLVMDIDGGRFMPTVLYADEVGVVHKVRYTFHEAGDMIRRYSHYGPWDERTAAALHA